MRLTTLLSRSSQWKISSMEVKLTDAELPHQVLTEGFLTLRTCCNTCMSFFEKMNFFSYSLYLSVCLSMVSVSCLLLSGCLSGCLSVFLSSLSLCLSLSLSHRMSLPILSLNSLSLSLFRSLLLFHNHN
jgi:hypothetical protein